MRSFLAAVLTFALLLAPALTRFGMASAAQPHQGYVMDQTGHCHMQRSDRSDPDKSAGKSCCMSTSLAAILQTAAPLGDNPMECPPLVVARASFHIHFLGEIATPPPRFL